MNRLTLCIIVALLTATTAQGAVSVSADPLVIEINGNAESGQEFSVGQEITITCNVVASASIYWSSGTIYNEASVDSALELYLGPVLLDSDTYDIIDTGYYEEASVSVNEPLSITYTLTEEGSYTIEAFSTALARYYTGAWYVAAIAESDQSLTFEVVSPAVLPVEIDIRPYCQHNIIFLRSWGTVPVAILSSEDFDATTVDPATVELAGAGVAYWDLFDIFLACERDVNQDGLLDLFCRVEIKDIDPDQVVDGYAFLSGSTYDGQEIEGSDEVILIEPPF